MQGKKSEFDGSDTRLLLTRRPIARDGCHSAARRGSVAAACGGDSELLPQPQQAVAVAGRAGEAAEAGDGWRELRRVI